MRDSAAVPMTSEPADRLVSLSRIVEARGIVSDRVHRTPLLSSSTAARTVEAATGMRPADGRIYLKAEHLQVTGSFKPRAATAKVAALDDRQRTAGLVTTSAGNAGQAYAWAARDQGVPAIVVMPEGAVRSKVEACLGYGAEVVVHGRHVGDGLLEMERLCSERGLVACHPYDDPDVIAGNGSLGLELLDDLPDVGLVVCGIGGGGLISGMAAALKETRREVRVVGVEPERSNAMALAFEAGHPVRIDPASVADGLGAPYAGEWTLPMCRRYLDGIVLLSDAEILAGVRFAAERLKQVLEPAGAAALAALLFGRVAIRQNERVAVVLSGGNVEVARLGELLADAAPLEVPR
ncbi:MAG TPA: threonine/serine dehydratase [Candidatus Dormibacteraeota bacterium]|nr:threonine/serine dehydratase [Candidatus Dormibacteraeota bacterium]